MPGETGTPGLPGLPGEMVSIFHADIQILTFAHIQVLCSAD